MFMLKSRKLKSGKRAAWDKQQPLTRKFCQYVPLTGVERHFNPNDIIVSKTDLTGRITYANRVFCEIASITEAQVLGAPHSIIRHPDMPRSVFKLMWDTLANEREIFAYVVNMALNGDHYWVFAHVTPTFNTEKKVISYHSNRRVPDPDKVAQISELYRMLKAIEDSGGSAVGMMAAHDRLMEILREKGMSYDEFIFSL